MSILDVVVVKAIQVGRSNDRWPCIVVELRPPSHIVVVPCSGSLDLYDPGRDLMLDDREKDFEGTGLKRSTYAIEGPFVEIPTTDVAKTIGRLKGDFASRFREWAGLD